jgi:hypothetical protein
MTDYFKIWPSYCDESGVSLRLRAPQEPNELSQQTLHMDVVE